MPGPKRELAAGLTDKTGCRAETRYVRMRKIILFTVLTTSVVVTARAGLSRLEALSMIETADNDAAVGGAGEVSRYQIKPWIWRQYSNSEAYRNRWISSEVAERHLAELESAFLKRAGRTPSDFDVYVLWNAGPTYYGRIGFSKSRVHPVIRERAQRYANLRQRVDLKSELASAVKPKAAVAKLAAASKPGLLERSGRESHQASIAPKIEPFWLVSPVAENSSLQSPLFSGIPLTTQPTPALAIDPSVLAVGGMTAQGR